MKVHQFTLPLRMGFIRTPEARSAKCGPSEDRAENSIMQVITLAVIAVTVCAGLMTMPNVLHGLRQQGLVSDVYALAKAQDIIYAHDGAYLANSDLDSLDNGSAGMKVSISEGSRIGMVIGGGGYLIVAQTKSLPALIDNSTGATITPGTSGQYMYKDSHCDTVWLGTSVYGVVNTGQPQDPRNSVTKVGVNKCLAPPTIPATPPAMKLYASSTSPSPTGTHWQY